jgi:hypothetical protein
MAVVVALGAVVTLVSGLLGLVFVLLPQLKPSPPPAHTAVHLSRVSFDPRVTFAEYLRRSRLPAGELDRATLSRRGALLTVHYAIIGYEDDRLPLRWQLLELRTGRQVGEQQAITITGTSQEDEGDWFVWAPAPRRAGRYAIDVQLLPVKGVVPLPRSVARRSRRPRPPERATGRPIGRPAQRCVILDGLLAQTRPDAARPMRAAESRTTAPSRTAPVTMNFVAEV